MESIQLAFIGGLGVTELLIIGGVAILLFGTKKLPELGRGLAKGIKEFREGVKDADTPDNKDSKSGK